MTYSLSHTTLDEHERLETKLEAARSQVNTVFLGQVKAIDTEKHQCTIAVWQKLPGDFTDTGILTYVAMPDLTLYYFTLSQVVYVPRVTDWVIALVPMSDIQNVINNDREAEVSPHRFPIPQALVCPIALNKAVDDKTLQLGHAPLEEGSVVNTIGDTQIFTTNFLKTISTKGDFFSILHQIVQILAAQVSPPNPLLNTLVASLGEFIKSD